jgi:hypothetical protein
MIPSTSFRLHNPLLNILIGILAHSKIHRYCPQFSVSTFNKSAILAQVGQQSVTDDFAVKV